jgi:hypothetical protein
MSWLSTAVVSGWQNIFHRSGGDRSRRIENALENIREAMLSGLEFSSATEASKLEMKVTYAQNLQDLWYLRGDLMAAIAAVDGEASARQKLTEISEMFRGLLPRSLATRPRRLMD